MKANAADITAVTLVEERARAEALFNSIGDGVITTDEFGKITRINPAALKILGYKESEILNKWFPQKIIAVDEHDQAISLIDRPITRAFLGGQSVYEKTYYRKKDGSKVPVTVTVSPIVLNHRPIGAVEVFRDITVEYEIDRMKSEFISLASHQLRTPLSAIKTYAHMLIDGYMGTITPPQRKSLQTVVVAANRMNELISTLLNITRIESGSITITPKLVNLQKVAEEIIKELDHTARAKGVTLRLKISTTHPTVKTDSLIIKEIISNLVSNAIKYTPDQGSVTIRLSSRGKLQALICVEDTGFGIPKHSQAQIFTKFFRAQNVVRRETSGTGLGLYLVKGLTEQLGGKVWFESEEDKGSRFYLVLPQRLDGPVKPTKSLPTPKD